MFNFKNCDNLYLNLIIKFDADCLFYPQIIEEKNEYESLNRGYLKTTKDDNEKKQKNISNNNLNENIKKISNSNADNTITENKSNSSKDINLSDNSSIMEQKQNNCDERTLNNKKGINELQNNNININIINNIQVFL